ITVEAHGFSRAKRAEKSWALAPVNSELPAVLAAPALDNNFLVGVELNGVTSLAVHGPEEAFLPATEGKIGHRGGHTDVDADVSRRRLIAEFARRRAAGGEDRSLISVRAAGQERDCLIYVVRWNQAENGAENFGGRELAAGRYLVQYSGAHKISGFIFRNFGMAAIHQHFGAFARALPDQTLNPSFAFGRNHRPHLDIGIEAKAHAHSRSSFCNGLAKSFLRLAHCDSNLHRQAALAGASECALADDLCGLLHVGIGQYDNVVLSSA